MIVLAASSVRDSIANYVEALVEVYIVLILIYLVSSMALAAGVRLPYSRVTDWIMQFLRDICEPFLRIFRKLVPAAGIIDLSPILAIVSLMIVEWLLVSVIRG